MVKDGYKQTDIGVIPNDWDIKTYDEIFNFLTTATYSRSQLSSDGEIQYLHYGDIHTKYNFALDFDKIELPKIKNEQLKKYPLLKDGDILMADASEDYDGICKSIEVKNIKEKKAISGLHTFLLRDKNENLAYGFKGYLSSNHLIKKQFDKLATGMKVYGVSKGNLKIVQIPIPPKEEQKAIATALSDTDELIEQLQKLISKKEDIKTATMQLLLTGKKRLDGFSDEWEEKSIFEFGDFKSGSGFPTKYQGDIDSKIPFYKVSDMNNKGNDTFMRMSNNYISEHVRKEVNASKIEKNSIVFAKIGAAIFLERKKILSLDSCIDNNMMAFIPHENIADFRFFHYLFLNIEFGKLVSATALPSLSGKDIGNLVFELPNKNEQTAISTILSDMDKELETLKSKLSKTKAIKEGMMSELLTGNTRLM